MLTILESSLFPLYLSIPVVRIYRATSLALADGPRVDTEHEVSLFLSFSKNIFFLLIYFFLAPKSLQMVIAAMKLKDTPWKESYDQPR